MERLRNCMEELLKFTLESYVNETLGFHLCLSKEFCSNLLKHDPHNSSPHTNTTEDSFEGIPQYPLHRRLSKALHQSILSGALCRTYSKMILIHEDVSLKQKEDEWDKLILDKGSELLNILKATSCEIYCQEPFSSLSKCSIDLDGLKTIKGRCAVGDCERIEPGALILLNKSTVLEVQGLHWYGSVSEMVRTEGQLKVLPGVKTYEEGLQCYQEFYVKDEEKSSSVLAIHLSSFAAQPYISLASMLSGLSYEGIQSLLGLAHTAGTISDGLPPPRSTLLSSFLAPYNPNVKGSSLTQGARALEKHAGRSSSSYWGNLSGSDSDKNRLAMEVISRLLAYCCWSNMHIVPPHGVVFEIRVADGYGARWSKDGTKFIGFLEPYMEDGHLKGWKH